MRRSTLVMALCAMFAFAAGCTRNDAKAVAIVNINSPTAPDHTGPPASGLRTSPPGNFNLHGSCVAGKARLSWDQADQADGYRIRHWTWTTKQGLSIVATTTNTSIEIGADASADNYWQIDAYNSVGETTSRSPDERDDKSATFACGRPAAQCSDGIDNDGDRRVDRDDPGCYPNGNYDPNDNDETDPPAGGGGVGTGPAPGPGGGTNNPPVGGTCSGSSISFPDLTASGQTRGFAVNVPSGCPWGLASNNTHVVSINPASGVGPASGTVTSLPGASGAAFVLSFNVGGTVISTRGYTIP